MNNGRRALVLLQDAVRLDSTFALGWQKLAMTLLDRGEPAAGRQAAQHAMDLRDRLPGVERHLVEGFYYDYIEKDEGRAIAAYRAVLDDDPGNLLASSTLALRYLGRGEFASARDVARRALQVDPGRTPMYEEVIAAELSLGDTAAARRVVDSMVQADPRGSVSHDLAYGYLTLAGRYAAADSAARAHLAAAGGDRDQEINAKIELRNLYIQRGKITQAERLTDEIVAWYAERDISAALFNTGYQAQMDVRYLGDTAKAARRLDAALARFPFARLQPGDRNYEWISWTYAVVARPKMALAIMHQAARGDSLSPALKDSVWALGIVGEVALRERRPAEAAVNFTRGWGQNGGEAYMPHAAHAWDLAGNADSAIALYTRYLSTVSSLYWRTHWLDPAHRAETYEALGRLHENRSQPDSATKYYGLLLDLWKDCDPVLRPKREAVRAALARVTAERGTRP